MAQNPRQAGNGNGNGKHGPETKANGNGDGHVSGAHPVEMGLRPKPQAAADDLPALVDAMLASYRSDRRGHHINRRFLPSRVEIIEVAELLLQLFYPGYFGRQDLDRRERRLPRRATFPSRRFREKLARQIEMSLCYRSECESQAAAPCTSFAKSLSTQFLRPIARHPRDLSPTPGRLRRRPGRRSTSTRSILAYPGLLAVTNLPRRARAPLSGVPLDAADPTGVGARPDRRRHPTRARTWARASSSTTRPASSSARPPHWREREALPGRDARRAQRPARRRGPRDPRGEAPPDGRGRRDRLRERDRARRHHDPRRRERHRRLGLHHQDGPARLPRRREATRAPGEDHQRVPARTATTKSTSTTSTTTRPSARSERREVLPSPRARHSGARGRSSASAFARITPNQRVAEGAKAYRSSCARFIRGGIRKRHRDYTSDDVEEALARLALGRRALPARRSQASRSSTHER